jgi:hypothetical protein
MLEQYRFPLQGQSIFTSPSEMEMEIWGSEGEEDGLLTTVGSLVLVGYWLLVEQVASTDEVSE